MDASSTNFLAVSLVVLLGVGRVSGSEAPGGRQPVAVISDPPGARVTLLTGGGRPIVGWTPFHSRIAPGPVTLRVAGAGRNPLQLEHSLEGPWRVSVYLDPKGQLLHRERVIPTGRWPKQVAIAPDGREVWVTTLGGPGSVHIHDLATGTRIAHLQLGHEGAVEVIFNRAGTRAYVTQMEAGLVYEIDVAGRRVLQTMEVGGSWPKAVCLSADEKSVFTSNWKSADVSEIDLASGRLRRRIPTVHVPRGLYATRDGRSLWVAGFGRGEVARIDLASGQSHTVFGGGGAVRHLVGDEAHGVLYASDMGKHCIWVIELATLAVRKLAETDPNPNTIALSPDGQVLFVSCRGPNGSEGYEGPAAEPGTLMVLDAQTGKQLDGLVAGEQPTALALSADGSLLIHSDLHDNRLEVFRVPDTASLRSGHGGRSATYRRDLKGQPLARVAPKPPTVDQRGR